MIRLEQLTIENIKNTQHGTVDFLASPNGGCLVGIYGQNGSGKTSVIDVMECARDLMAGKQLEPRTADLLMKNEASSAFELVFAVSNPELLEGEPLKVSYGASLVRVADSVKISEESISLAGSGRSKRNLISYAVSSSGLKGEAVDKFATVGPSGRWRSILASSKNAAAAFSANEITSFDLGKSFVFSDGFSRAIDGFVSEVDKRRESGNLPKTLQAASSETLEPLERILSLLRGFAQNDLVVINQKHEAVISLGVMLLSSGQAINGSRGFALDLSDQTVVSEQQYTALCSAFNVSNVVLERLIPGLRVEVCKLGDRLLDSGEPGIELELLSNRNGTKVPLRCESTGIQKVVSILGALIAAYNNPGASIFIDELDSGVFEYLLGELLEVMEPRMKGQLVFTAHNLRPLEKLPLRSLVFTTSNPSNRFVRLKGIHNSNNVRSQYFKSIVLGGQGEEMYQPTDKSMIAAAFSKAGHPGEDLDFASLLQRYAGSEPK